MNAPLFDATVAVAPGYNSCTRSSQSLRTAEARYSAIEWTHAATRKFGNIAVPFEGINAPYIQRRSSAWRRFCSYLG